MSKITLDGTNKLVIISSGYNDLNIQQDIYSVWKEWALENPYYLKAMSSYGGDIITSNFNVYNVIVLNNGWKLSPYTISGTNLYGTIYSDDDLSVTISGYSVNIISDWVKPRGLTDDQEELLNSIKTNIQLFYDIETGRRLITNNQQIFYKPDNTTEIMRFNLKDKNGDPSMTSVFDREKINE